MQELLIATKEGLPVELVFAGILFLVGSIGRILYKFIKKTKESRQTKKYYNNLVRTQPITERELNILSIGNAMPEYEHINIEHSQKKFFIDFPEDLKEEILKKVPKGVSPEKNPYIFHPDVSFSGLNDFDDIVIETGIENLKELIEKHRRIVAHHFLERQNGCYFNSKKFGVYSFDSNSRLGDHTETPILEIHVYETDYFTHKIFRSIYEELKQQEHPITKVTIDNISKYRAFTTSLGVNAYVITDSIQGDTILISRRSSAASETRGQKPYNSTVMEGLSFTDIDIQTKEISMKNFLYRALYEEIGIPLSYHNTHNQTLVHFYDFFLEKNFFELGITASVKVNTTYEQGIEPLVAKDKALEIDEIIPLSFKQAEINQFVENHTFMKQGLYTLKMISARRNITVRSQNNNNLN